MGLADLKKSSTQSKPPAPQAASIEDFIDDFIDGADRYAMGMRTQSAEVISIASRRAPQAEQEDERQASGLERLQALLQQRLATSKAKTESKRQTFNHRTSSSGKRSRHFRKATFSLAETNIAHLAEMTQGNDLCKSALIRLLIENHYLLSPQERRKLEQLLQAPANKVIP